MVTLHNFSNTAQTVRLRLKEPGGRRLVDILGEEHSRADSRGAHEIALDGYGYRWYRIGAADETLTARRSDSHIDARFRHELRDSANPRQWPLARNRLRCFMPKRLAHDNAVLPSGIRCSFDAPRLRGNLTILIFPMTPAQNGSNSQSKSFDILIASTCQDCSIDKGCQLRGLFP